MDKDIIANIKSLGMDMINAAGSGHPGIVLGAAPIMYTLFAKHMHISVNDPTWVNRDRFVLSAGHGSALLYATLFMAGYDYTIEDLQNFRRLNSKTPGHPELNPRLGVEVSTGPLGQGFANGVGFALASKILSKKFVFPRGGKFEKERALVDYKTYILCGDGDLMEGISYESASLAGTLNLDNLIVLYDSNNISLDGDTSNTFTESVVDRFKSFGWYTDKVKDGNNVAEIDKAISKAQSASKPALIEICTVIGKDSMYEGSAKVHGSPLSKEDIDQIKIKLNIINTPFYVNDVAVNAFRNEITSRSSRKYEIWSRNYKDFVTDVLGNDLNAIKFLFKREEMPDFSKIVWDLEEGSRESLRDSNSKVMNTLSKYIHSFIGGSADVGSSTKTFLTNFEDVKDGRYNGKNIWFGVREHAMGAIMNGLALSSFTPFGSTFLVFSDYLKPAIRMAALMNLPCTYIFTHDSINIGQDGPTHQPIEQLASLRSIPNMKVYRPADQRELIGCWNNILHRNGPAALVLSRNEALLQPNSQIHGVTKGAYVIRKEKERLMGIIIATGLEVEAAITIASDLLRSNSIDIRVVSMPSMELFLEQPEEYRDELLPKGVKTIVIEAGSSFGWDQFVYSSKYLVTLNEFGHSGTKDEVAKSMNFEYKQIRERVLNLLK